MTLDTLIEILNDYREEFGGDAEVRIVTQHNWPFENSVHGVTSGQEINAQADDDSEDSEDSDDDVSDDAMVYIVEGTQLGYGSKRAWDSARDC